MVGATPRVRPTVIVDTGCSVIMGSASPITVAVRSVTGAGSADQERAALTATEGWPV